MEAIIILGILGVFFGIIIGIFNKFFKVEVDSRVQHINDMLPQFNCGACGFPGCMALAEAVVKEEARVSDCKPIKQDAKEAIWEYIEEAVGPNGERLDINKVK